MFMLKSADPHHNDSNAVGLLLANLGRAEPLLPASDMLAMTAFANEEWGKHVDVKGCSVLL